MIQPEDWRGASARVRVAALRQHDLEVTLLGALREVNEASGPFGWSAALEVPERFIDLPALIRGAFAECGSVRPRLTTRRPSLTPEA